MAGATHLQLSAGEHVAYFYDAEHELAALSAEYLASALVAGGGAIAIVTPEHRAMFAAQLARRGIDVAYAQRDGTLVFLDARTTLNQFLVDGVPDRRLFRAVISSYLTPLAHGPVHAYGEMVGLLWEVGDVVGTIKLESLWNELLGGGLRFSLLCGYPASALGPSPTAGIVDVCDQHSDVHSGLPVDDEAQAQRTFPATPQSAGLARAFALETLRKWGDFDELTNAAVLIVSELAANALQHAREGAFSVSLQRDGNRLRLSVGDGDPSVPSRSAMGSDAASPTGRGLLIVDRLASDWGCSARADGKLMWADLERPGHQEG